MKKRLLFFLVTASVIGSLGLFPVLASSKINTEETNIIQKFSQLSEEEIEKTLKGYSNSQLLEEVNELSKYANQTDITGIALEIVDRVDSYSYDELIEQIQNTENTDEFVDFMIDTYIYKSNKSDNTRINNNDLKELLKDNSIKASAKSKIILEATDENDIEMITNFIQDENDDIASASLKKLSIIAPSIAKEEAENLIENKNGISEQRLRAADKAMVKELRDKQNKTENLEFIKTNMEIFEETSSESLKDTAIFCLAEIRDIDAVRSIINNENVDLELKVYTVAFNFKVLDELLNQSEISSDDIDLIISSMEIHPILDFKDKLIDLKSKISDEAIINRLNDVISNIEINGVYGINK